MISNSNVSFFVQIQKKRATTSGIYRSNKSVVCVDESTGLMSFSNTTNAESIDLAEKSIEILLDDIQLNQPSDKDIQQSSGKLSAVNLNESIENINDYFFTQNTEIQTDGAELSLAACQVISNFCSFIRVGPVNFFLYRNTKLQPAIKSEDSLLISLGETAQIKADLSTIEVENGDIVVMASPGFFATKDIEHIRLTLLRFPNNLEIAARQIASKAQHKSISSDAVLSMMRINQVIAEKPHWFS